MGLDSVELVMEVEDRFRISLSDAECVEVQTVADMFALVVAKLPVARICPTARSFFELRRATMDATSLARHTLRPGTPLGRLAPPQQRRQLWCRLRAAGLAMPRLKVAPHDPLRRLGAVLLVSWLLAAAVLVLLLGMLGGAIAATLGIAFGIIVHLLASQRSTEFPDGCHTLGDLARRLPPTTLRQGDSQSERDVLDTIRRITAEQLGLRLDEVQPESRFVDDLGLG